MNDIFVPVVVVDNSLYIFSFLLLLSFIILYVIYLFYKRRNNFIIKDEKYYLDLLLSLDTKDVKYKAYRFEYYLKNLPKTAKQQKSFDDIMLSLWAQKYQKIAPPISVAIEEQMKKLLSELRSSYA